MPKKIDLTGHRFGRLVVLEKTNRQNSQGAQYWKCQCDCGNIVEVITASLNNGHTTSCGCYAKSAEAKIKRRKNIIDLTGQQFGRLTVLYMAPHELNQRVKWHCKCECGNEIDVLGSQLREGKTKSCGCLRYQQSPLLDIQGQRFGKLIAIEPTQQRIGSSVVWKCQCDCGNIYYTTRAHLMNNYTNSCGCSTISKGELKIKDLLTQLNYTFETQKTFKSCKFPDTNHVAYFDFYLPLQNCLIEYDGEQHFIQKDYFGDYAEFQSRIAKDKFKDEWAYANNIKLIRIPYTDYDKITKDYLQERIE